MIMECACGRYNDECPTEYDRLSSDGRCVVCDEVPIETFESIIHDTQDSGECYIYVGLGGYGQQHLTGGVL